jgi:hypothetical protein
MQADHPSTPQKTIAYPSKEKKIKCKRESPRPGSARKHAVADRESLDGHLPIAMAVGLPSGFASTC